MIIGKELSDEKIYLNNTIEKINPIIEMLNNNVYKK